MASLLLYTASISQTSTNAPVADTGASKAEISGSWSRLGAGLYKLTRQGGGYFTPFSGSISGSLFIQVSTNTTSSYATFVSSSDTSSLYLTTYSDGYTSTPTDNIISGSLFFLNVSIGY